VSGQVTWATGFVGRRLDITNRLIQHYPQAQFLMLTPAWVDYSRWLGIEADSPSEPTSLSDQIEISAALTKAFAARKGTQKILFSGFASFDPARCLTLGKNEPDPIEVIDKALGAGKIIGVKLYPPMGFQAIGNAGIPSGAYPDTIRSKIANPGQAIDRQLRRLYEVCIRHDAPVMAHCGANNYPNALYKDRANPAYWLELLMRALLLTCGSIWRILAASGVLENCPCRQARLREKTNRRRIAGRKRLRRRWRIQQKNIRISTLILPMRAFC